MFEPLISTASLVALMANPPARVREVAYRLPVIVLRHCLNARIRRRRTRRKHLPARSNKATQCNQCKRGPGGGDCILGPLFGLAFPRLSAVGPWRDGIYYEQSNRAPTD